MAKSPFREMSGDEEIVTFRFHTIALWKEEASMYLHEHLVNLYPLLPAMAHVDKLLLLQALEEMVQYYKDIVEGRFPDLLPLAQEKLPRVKTAESLEIFITQLALAPNEETARWLLNTL